MGEVLPVIAFVRCFFHTIMGLYWHAMPPCLMLNVQLAAFQSCFFFQSVGCERVSSSQIMTHVVVTLMPDQRDGCFFFFSGITQAGLLSREQTRMTTSTNPLTPSKLPPQQQDKRAMTGIQTSLIQFLCVHLCVCFPACMVFLQFHSRLHYFQLISFYKARPLHNYPLSIRSHPVQHCRLKQC